MPRQAKELIADYSAEHTVKGTIEAVGYVLQARKNIKNHIGNRDPGAGREGNRYCVP